MGGCQLTCSQFQKQIGQMNLEFPNKQKLNREEKLSIYKLPKVNNVIPNDVIKDFSDEDYQSKHKKYHTSNLTGTDTELTTLNNGFSLEKKTENNIFYQFLYTPDRQIITNYVKIQLPNGESYIGQVYNVHMIKGIGIYKSNLGWEYRGDFMDNRIEGFGYEFYDNYALYEGEFVNSKKEGYGIMMFNQENKYEGEMKGDSIEGIGTFYKGSDMNIKIQGIFKENELCNIGVYNDANRQTIYEGSITKEGIFQGIGVLYDGKEKIIYIGSFDNSKINGDCIIIEIVNQHKKVKKCKFYKGNFEKEYDDNYKTIYDKIKDSIYSDFANYY